MSKHLFCFGTGYVAQHLAKLLLPDGWQVSGTCRSEEKRQMLTALGINAYVWDIGNAENTAMQMLRDVTHVLHSIPPDGSIDPLIPLLTHLPQQPTWIGYLSTTGVYGDHHGEWVDENTPVNPPNVRSQRRVDAETGWLASGLPVHIFRLSGIYGAGRSAIDAIKSGTARRVDKPGQYFSRIHVEDIVQTLQASMAHPHPGAIYNLADDEPAAQCDVVAYAAKLLGVEPPLLVPFAQADLSEMARSFYASNRRVKNHKIKRELGITLKYPTYREGLQAILTEEKTNLAKN